MAKNKKKDEDVLTTGDAPTTEPDNQETGGGFDEEEAMTDVQIVRESIAAQDYVVREMKERIFTL